MPRVLIVEDDRNIGNLVRSYLERDGYRVAWVRSGEDGAGASWTGMRPDLVVLDIMLPGMDGLDVLRRVCARLRRCRSSC